MRFGLSSPTPDHRPKWSTFWTTEIGKCFGPAYTEITNRSGAQIEVAEVTGIGTLQEIDGTDAAAVESTINPEVGDK